jgi:hypothetical protein
MARRKRDRGLAHLNNVIVLWVLVILVNFGIMWIGQFAITSAGTLSSIILAIVVVVIFYVDSCLATVDTQKERLEIKSDILKPSKIKVVLSSLMVVFVLIMF